MKRAALLVLGAGIVALLAWIATRATPSADRLVPAGHARASDTLAREPELEGASVSTSQLVNGWVRVRGEVGRHQIEVDGGPRDAFECVIPLGGYGKGVWHVRTSR